MSLRAKRGNLIGEIINHAYSLCTVCDCFVVPPRNDMEHNIYETILQKKSPSLKRGG